MFSFTKKAVPPPVKDKPTNGVGPRVSNNDRNLQVSSKIAAIQDLIVKGGQLNGSNDASIFNTVNSSGSDVLVYASSDNGHGRGRLINSSPRLSSSDDDSCPIGEGTGFHELKSYNVPGLRLPALDSTAIQDRTVVISRLASGDFGFQLRRAQISEHKTVLFVEPVSPGYQNTTGLVPGDQLLEVNGDSVHAMTRDEVVKLIKNSKDKVTLKVRPVPELIELTLRSAFSDELVSVGLTSGRGDLQLQESSALTSKRLRSDPDKSFDSTDDVSAAQQERYWLAHKAGYAACFLRSSDRVEVKAVVELLWTGSTLEVDRDDLDKCNPEEYDKTEDLSKLQCLNECSVLHVLRQRYGSNLVYTHAGSFSTIFINPVVQLSSYSDKVMRMFRGAKRDQLPPHIYNCAQQMYRKMLVERRNQSIIFTGRSGSGKSSQARHLLHYLCSVAGSVGHTVTFEKLSAAHILLDAFGCCRTKMNINATRFCCVTTLEYDHLGQISNGLFQVMLLEANRVVWRPEEESTFNVFYYLWECAERRIRSDLLQLDSIADGPVLFIPLASPNDRDSAIQSFSRLIAAFDALKISEKESDAVWLVLGALIHLAVAGAAKGPTSLRSQFLKPVHAQKAAMLLGISFDDLHRAIFVPSESVTATVDKRPNSSIVQRTSISALRNLVSHTGVVNRQGSAVDKTSSIVSRTGDSQDALFAFMIGLYKEAFSLLLSLINRALSSNYRTLNSITVLDSPGFQNPATVYIRPQRAATFDEFLFNYCQERLHGLFFDVSFKSQLEIYQQENVEVEFEEPFCSPQLMIDLIDKQSQQNLIRSTNIELRSKEKRGILWLLDEESIFPGATDESFLDRVFVHHGEMKEDVVKKSKYHNHFVLKHLLGSNPVLYNASGWKDLVRENPVSKTVLPLLQESQREALGSLFAGLRSNNIAGVSGLDSATGRRTTAIVKNVGNLATVKRKSICAMAKAQMDCIVETLKRTSHVNFVHCFLPQHEAGVGRRFSQNDGSENSVINVPLLRSQVCGLQLLEAIRLDKVGFPERMFFGEFRRRFDCLIPVDEVSDHKFNSEILDDRQRVERLIAVLDIDQSSIRLSSSQVFMRSRILNRLEDMRDGRLHDVISKFQAHCRAFLAKKAMEKRRVRVTALKCIQKNCLKYFELRCWVWWRLYTKVVPLLGIQTEGNIKSAMEDLESTKERLKKAEQSNIELRVYCDRLEAKLSNAQGDLAEEKRQLTQTSEMLEQENMQKLCMEKECAELKAKVTVLERQSRRLEMEVMEYHNLGSVVSDNTGEEDEPFKERLEQIRHQLTAKTKENECIKREASAQLQETKRQVEKKIAEALNEANDCRQQVQVHKRKAQRVQEELQDLRLHLQSVTARNNELEKKQKRFDNDLNVVRDEVLTERTQKEKFYKESQENAAKVYRLEKDLQEATEDLKSTQSTNMQLSQNLEELGKASDTISESEVVTLRRTKCDLERKCQDQEEELDDLAGELQQNKQTVLKLEMQIERLKMEHQKELQNKEEEVEEFRNQAQRKLQIMEQQMDDVIEQRQQTFREKRELEEKLREVSEHAVERDLTVERQLRRDYHRTKVLLRDAQNVLQQNKDLGTSRGQVKQLKNQLEDSECARMALMKSKQNVEAECGELRQQLEQSLRAKAELDEKCSQVTKEKNDLTSQIDDHVEELNQLLKKYRSQVQQSSVDHITMSEQLQTIADLQKSNEEIKEELSVLTTKLQYYEVETTEKVKLQLAELRIRDLESKLDVELLQHARFEALISRSKDTTERLQQEILNLKAARDKDQEIFKRLQRQTTDFQDQITECQKRESEALLRKADLESALNRAEQAHEATLSDLKLTQRRVDDLQAALTLDLSDVDENGDEDSQYYDGVDEAVLLQSRLSSPAARSMTDASARRSASSRSSISSLKEMPVAVVNGGTRYCSKLSQN